ncbi:MAG: cytochrome P460 family protein [Anaerolineales bacterium]|nr:cytochrome P460 family protein [Anaerolineales bacterium]
MTMAPLIQRLLGWAAALAAGTAAVMVWANEVSSPVQFPEDYKQGVHYATVERGNVREEIYTSREAIEAARNNQPLPEGTVILMEDYRDGKLLRYIAMEKTAGYGGTQPADLRTGDWAFQSFGPDRRIDRRENLARCMACHQPQAKNDFVFTYGRMQTLGSKRP